MMGQNRQNDRQSDRVQSRYGFVSRRGGVILPCGLGGYRGLVALARAGVGRRGHVPVLRQSRASGRHRSRSGVISLDGRHGYWHGTTENNSSA